MSGKRARLVSKGGETLQFHYNPSTVTLNKTAQWRNTPVRNAKNAPEPSFVGTMPATLKLTALVDAFDDRTRSVEAVVKQLLTWTRPTAKSRDKTKPQPEFMHLQWGSSNWFTGYLKSVDVRYTMFDTNGIPLRASIDLVMEEVPTDPPWQNPTSGGVAGRRAATLGANESLAAVAYREYGDAALWRGLADANDIDDPARVPAGRRLLVPPVGEARRLSNHGRLPHTQATQVPDA
jgi:Contractile injection system tube protein